MSPCVCPFWLLLKCLVYCLPALCLSAVGFLLRVLPLRLNYLDVHCQPLVWYSNAPLIPSHCCSMSNSRTRKLVGFALSSFGLVFQFSLVFCQILLSFVKYSQFLLSNSSTSAMFLSTKFLKKRRKEKEIKKIIYLQSLDEQCICIKGAPSRTVPESVKSYLFLYRTEEGGTCIGPKNRNRD